MKVHCLGTTGYHPSDHRHTSCYFLPADGIVLDAGSGMFRLPPLIDTDHLDILLSHVHLDHIVGLTYLHDVLSTRPVEKVVVWGEAAKLQAVQEHLFHDLIFPAPINVVWEAIDDRKRIKIGTGGAVTVDWLPQEHPGGSVAYRLHWWKANKTIVYATDTSGDLSQQSLQWMKGADLLMHECYFRDDAQQWAAKTGHCWTTRAAQVAQAADVNQLLLTHINPLAIGPDPIDLQVATRIFKNTHVASDGDVVEF